MRRLFLVLIFGAVVTLGGVFLREQSGDRGMADEAALIKGDPLLDGALAAFERGETEQAILQLTAIAEKGEPFAQIFLARLSTDGIGVAQDFCRALEWYQRAAANGDGRGTVGLALAHQYGRCTPFDYFEAERYFKAAARRGEADAHLGLSVLYGYRDWNQFDPYQSFGEAEDAWEMNRGKKSRTATFAAFLLGRHYQNGDGVDRNPFLAKRYYSLAADQGLVEAQYLLAGLYSPETNLIDREDSLVWVFTAAEQDFGPAIEARDQAVEKLDQNRIAELQLAARSRLRRIAGEDSLLRDADDWCRAKQSGSFDCLLFAFADMQMCDPSISETYFKSRYMHSRAYDTCRKQIMETRRAGSRRE